jgi:hypothetical protein
MYEDPDVYDSVADVYIGVSFVSVLFTLIVAVVSMSSDRLRRDHYSSMVFTITVCDLLYTLKFLVSAAAWDAGYKNERSSFHLIQDDCMSATAYGIFTGLACVSWNAAWTIDFLCVLINPMRNTASQRRWYHVGCWLVCILGTILSLALESHKSSSFHTCVPSVTDPSSFIFTIPLLIALLIAIVSLVYAVQRLNAGTRDTAILRRRLLQRHAAYVVAFIFLWLWPLLHEFIDSDNSSPLLVFLDAFSVSGQAAIFACIRLSEPGAWAILKKLFRQSLKRFYRGALRICGYKESPLSSRERPILSSGTQNYSSTADLSNSISKSLDNGSTRDDEDRLLGRTTDDAPAVYSASSTDDADDNRPHINRSISSPSSYLSYLQKLVPFYRQDSDYGKSSGGGTSFFEGSTRRLLSNDHDHVILSTSTTMYNGDDSNVLSASVSMDVVGGGRLGKSSTTLSMSSSSSSLSANGGTLSTNSTSSFAQKSGPGGWDLGAVLRVEMGKAMLTALCHAIASGERDALSLLEEKDNEAVVTDVFKRSTNVTADRRPLLSWLRDSTSTILRKTSFLKLPKVGESWTTDMEVKDGNVEVLSICDKDFSLLRLAASVRADELITSLNPRLLEEGKLKAHFSDAASSSFFCRSTENTFIVKTISAYECEVLLRLLPSYISHLANHPNSLLCRIYGLFGMRVDSSSQQDMMTMMHHSTSMASLLGGQSPASPRALSEDSSRVFFVLMGSVFPIRSPGPSALTFDLKGSTVNRRAKKNKTARKERGEVAEDDNDVEENGNVANGRISGTESLSTVASSSSSSTTTLKSESKFKSGGKSNSQNKKSTPSASLIYQDLEFREAIPFGLPVVDATKLAQVVHEDDDVVLDRFRASVVDTDFNRKDAPRKAKSSGLTDVFNFVKASDLTHHAVVREGAKRAKQLLQQIRIDADLLSSQNLMDYSLLLLIVPVDVEADLEDEESTGAHEGRRQSRAMSRSLSRAMSLVGGGGRGGGGEPNKYFDEGEESSIDLTLMGAKAVGPYTAAAFIDELSRPPLDDEKRRVSRLLPFIPRFSPLSAHVCALGSPMRENDIENEQVLLYSRHVLCQVGVIDLLQFFDTQKKAENVLKRVVEMDLEANVSAIAPQAYAERIVDFATNVFAPISRV